MKEKFLNFWNKDIKNKEELFYKTRMFLLYSKNILVL